MSISQHMAGPLFREGREEEHQSCVKRATHPEKILSLSPKFENERATDGSSSRSETNPPQSVSTPHSLTRGRHATGRTAGGKRGGGCKRKNNGEPSPFRRSKLIPTPTPTGSKRNQMENTKDLERHNGVGCWKLSQEGRKG
eukprot:350920_1